MDAERPTPTGTAPLPGWHTALAFALVGESVALPAADAPDVAALIWGLAQVGWTPGRVAEHAKAVLAHEGIWPHPVPTTLRAGLGFAQLHAALAGAREALGLAVLEVRSPSTRTKPDADERRLLADVPPHHVPH